MTTATVPWGLTRMRRYPDAVSLPGATVTVDPVTQTGRWIGPDGDVLPATARHKRSETSKETSTKTSLDGAPDQGSDQEGDTD
ncbi:putative ATP-grasp-modified RiPP [Streptomyces sp. NPDC014734]|uniref:putative ATP-grasp-modified RiPP n=1 Tax=Streptomyces sp. NPDC014734 TaxID=3364886 RepID=UPI0036FEFF90